MNSRLLSALAGAVLCSIASQASASIIDFIYTGTVASGSDLNDTWRSGDANLAGDSFTLVFSVDSNQHTFINQTPYQVFDIAQPLSVVLTIGSHSETVGTYQTEVRNEQRYYTFGTNHADPLSETLGSAYGTSSDNSSQSYVTAGVYDNDGSNHFPFSLTTLFDVHITATNGVLFNGGFSLGNPDPYTFGTFNITEVRSVLASGVPEPSTWAMMLLGFAGVGFMTYRRSRKDNNLALAAA